MEPFGAKATTTGICIAAFASWRGLRKKSLTTTGAMAACSVGFLSAVSGLRGFNLLVFYQVGSTATKFKKELKTEMDGTLATTGTSARGPSQVLACSVIAVVLGLVHAIYCGPERPISFESSGTGSKGDEESTLKLASSLTCAILAHHATCLADTLASEMGILSKSSPVLITQPWKQVPPGTNGGVTLEGFGWSALGGFILGCSSLLWDSVSGLAIPSPFTTVAFSSTCGLVGSILDSLLGATIQETFYDAEAKLVYQSDDMHKPKSSKHVIGRNWLTNEQVNLVSVAITTALGGWVLGPIFFQ
eukprot:Nitzschia sp. Nitz4//scaffold21_size171442//77328//78239//NITZ4_002165-RA/size171442-processed-gene-0.50-mRNA-1//-1//CDS//3329542423//5380//frame0